MLLESPFLNLISVFDNGTFTRFEQAGSKTFAQNSTKTLTLAFVLGPKFWPRIFRKKLSVFDRVCHASSTNIYRTIS